MLYKIYYVNNIIYYIYYITFFDINDIFSYIKIQKIFFLIRDGIISIL